MSEGFVERRGLVPQAARSDAAPAFPGPGNMQAWSMQLTHIIDYAARWHPEQEIVSRSVEGPTVISTYADLHHRTQLCALALRGLGVRPGTMVATLAWNTTRHVEVWFAIFGSGAVCHTLNPRLADKDLLYIMNDAKDVVLISDISFAAQLARLVPQCPTLRAVVMLTDRQHMPRDLALPCPLLCYEELLDAQVGHLPFRWVTVPEDSACGLCYTSGTTGNPKGVLYSHRSNFLHAMMSLQHDSIPLGSASTCMAVVPMFHANVWGLIFSAPMVGAKLVLPGPYLDGESVYHMMETYKVTVTAAVPTVWNMVLSTLADRPGLKLTSLKMAVIGGAAATMAMVEALEHTHGVTVHHLWGMTELSPIGTVCSPKAALVRKVGPEGVLAYKLRQGRPHILCDMRIVNDEGETLVHDGTAFGHLQVRGPIVMHNYRGHDAAVSCATDPDGWFATGDVGSICPLGHLQITDRSKDVIKSGGEWISSLDMENQASSHPEVAEAAVIAVPHPKWGERPLLIVVPKKVARLHEASRAGPAALAALAAMDRAALRTSLLTFLKPRVARFAMPDDVAVVAEIPHNATGKVSKLMLRQQFKDYQAPATAAEDSGSEPRSRL